MNNTWRLSLLIILCTAVSFVSAQQPGDDAKPAAEPPVAEASDPAPTVSEAEAKKGDCPSNS